MSRRFVFYHGGEKGKKEKLAKRKRERGEGGVYLAFIPIRERKTTIREGKLKMS